jgi:hypothetical protein
MRKVLDIWVYEGCGNRGAEQTALRGGWCSLLLTKYRSDDHIKNTEMGRACSKYGESK